MNEPPRKRRKTSSPPQAPSSPLRKPPRRPSFASPTKASLARDYPNLLPTHTPPREDVHARAKQARAYVLDGAGTSPKDIEVGPEEEMELPWTEGHRQSEAQEGLRRGGLFPLSSKQSPRASDTVTRSPLKDAPAAQHNQLTRPEEDALDTDGSSNEEAQKTRLDPEVERRKQEKAQLEREIIQLEAQVSRCTKEIAAEQKRTSDETLLPAQRVDLT